MHAAEERLSNARAQRNRLLAAFEGIHAAEEDMEAVIARFVTIPTCITMSLHGYHMFITPSRHDHHRLNMMTNVFAMRGLWRLSCHDDAVAMPWSGSACSHYTVIMRQLGSL